MKRLVPVFLLAVLVLGGLLGWKLWDQDRALRAPAGGTGVVEGTTVHLASRVGGRISQLVVAEGQPVAAGDLVAKLDCVEPEAALAEARARLAAAREQASAAEKVAAAAAAQVGVAKASAGSATAQARALSTQGGAAERQAERLVALGEAAPYASLDQVKSSAVGLEAQAAAARSQATAAEAQARAASGQASAARAQAEAARQQVAAVEAVIARAQLAVDECRLTAPRAGTVELLPWEEGELVGPGSTVATLVDTSTVTAAFYLPNAELAAARPGAPATVRADAWPDRTFEGTVTRVATEAEFTPRNIQTRTDRDRLVYRVEVDVPNPDGALRPGMPVEVRLAAVAP
jgi:HlyD family secretion protein